MALYVYVGKNLTRAKALVKAKKKGESYWGNRRQIGLPPNFPGPNFPGPNF